MIALIFYSHLKKNLSETNLACIFITRKLSKKDKNDIQVLVYAKLYTTFKCLSMASWIKQDF